MRTRLDSTSFVLLHTLHTQSEFQKWFQKLASNLHTGDEILYAGRRGTWRRRSATGLVVSQRSSDEAGCISEVVRRGRLNGGEAVPRRSTEDVNRDAGLTEDVQQRRRSD